MRKFKTFWDFEAEQRYLNEMAAQGHILKNYSAFGVYEFTDGAPQRLNYKIDYRMFKNKDEFANYVALFEDAGWHHVCGSRANGIQFFLAQRVDCTEDIFSDYESAAARYKTLGNICLVNMIVFFGYLFVVLSSAGGKWSSLGFLTPGLWERTGFAFWKGFLIELPFVILRVGFPILFAVLAVLYGYWAFKAKHIYSKAIR